MEYETITRKWGNSLGITLPRDIVEKENIKENEKLSILILKKSRTLSDTFGIIKTKKSAQKIKDELKKELYND